MNVFKKKGLVSTTAACKAIALCSPPSCNIDPCRSPRKHRPPRWSRFRRAMTSRWIFVI
jgi:hypothetical protein